MKILCLLFGHAWIDTHRNRYQLSTRQQCRWCRKAQVWKGGIYGQWHNEQEQTND